MPTPQHPKKEGRACIEVFRECGWTVDKKKKYFRARCSCGKHQTSIHLTPSSADYFKHKERQARKCCPKGTRK